MNDYTTSRAGQRPGLEHISQITRTISESLANVGITPAHCVAGGWLREGVRMWSLTILLDRLVPLRSLVEWIESAFCEDINVQTISRIDGCYVVTLSVDMQLASEGLLQ